MKKNFKAILAATVALILAFTALPLSLVARAATQPAAASAAAPQPTWTVPEGYNAHDYNKCVAFLEQTDENGIKNGAKLNQSYDPNDHTTWGSYVNSYGNTLPCFAWGGNDELRIVSITFENLDLVGTLDLSYMDLSDVYIYRTRITTLDLTGSSLPGSLITVEGNGYIEYGASCGNFVQAEISAYSVDGSFFEGFYERESGELIPYDYVGIDGYPGAGSYMLDYFGFIGGYGSHPQPGIVARFSNTPLEYNSNDYTKCVNFFEQTDENGVKNGDKLIANYNPNDPDAWGLDWWRVANGEKRLASVDIRDHALVGTLDLSGCVELGSLDCSRNSITALDVTGCTKLMKLVCFSNLLTELDFSTNEKIMLDSLVAEGNGYVSFYQYMRRPVSYHLIEIGVFAVPANGSTFEDFVFLNHDDWGGDVTGVGQSSFWTDYTNLGTIIARFSGGYPQGDVSGDGKVEMSDAIIALRAALRLITLSDEQVQRTDMNGDGFISVTDALMILHVAMNLA